MIINSALSYTLSIGKSQAGRELMISSKADSRSEEITEHKLAEEALRAERDRAEKYLNIVEVIIVALDTQARITLLNRKGHQVLGYEEGELIGKDWIHTCLRPQDHRSVHEVNRKINAGEIQAFEYYENYVLTKKGEERFIAWHTTILKDDNSRIIGTLSSGEDITERKLAEENAKESEEKYRQLVENSLMGIGLSKGNQVIFANSALLRIFGYDSLEEFLKIPLIDPVAPESRELIATRKREISEGKSMPSVFEYTILRKDGTTRILRASSSSITLGGEIYKQTTFQDITEQKQAEEALRESENKYRAIFENTGTATVIVEDDTTISLANSEFGRLTGYSREEIEGKMSWTEFVVKEDLEKMLRQHKLRRTDQAAALKSYEFRIKDRNGNIKDILLNIDIIPGTKKSIASLLDITERKRAEEELKRTQSSLRIAMDLVKLVQWEYDVETDLFTFDDQFYSLYGTTAEREGGPLMSSQDYARKFIPPEEAPLVAKEISKSLATTDPNFTGYLEHRIIRADGTEGFIAVRYAVVKDDKGHTIKTYGANQDITDRKRMENALRQSEERFKAQYRNSPIPTFTWHKQGADFILIDFNEATKEITNGRVMEFVGRRASELYANRQEILKDLHRCHDEGVVIKKEIVSQNFVPGRLIISTFGPIRPDLVLVQIEDITERKRAEEALRESETRYRTLFDAGKDSIFLFPGKADGMPLNFIDVNLVACEKYGYTRDEFLTMSPSDLIAPEYHEMMPALGAMLTEKQKMRAEWEDIAKDGHRIPVDVSVTLFELSGQPICMAVVRDMTERKLAEKALKDSEKRLAAIIEFLPDATFVIDNERTVIAWNRAMEAMTGIKAKDILGKGDYEYALPFYGEREAYACRPGARTAAQRSRIGTLT